MVFLRFRPLPRPSAVHYSGGKDPIHFVEHDELLDLFAEYEIGIRAEPDKFYQVDASRYDFLKT